MLPVALIFRFETVAMIGRQVERNAPDLEAGGLLFGPPRSGQSVATRAIELWNAAPDPERMYSMDPDQQARATAGMIGQGFELVGTYHSHPSGNPKMSTADAAMAEATGKLLIIAPGAPGLDWQWCLYDPVARAEVGFRIAPPGQFEPPYPGPFPVKRNY